LIGEYNEELETKDVAWISATGQEMTEAEWQNGVTRCFGMLLDGRAQFTGLRQRGTEAAMLWVLNGYHDIVGFKLPTCPAGNQWRLVIDTNLPDLEEGGIFKPDAVYDVTARSTLLFVAQG
jgi:glycogen operon protein